MVLLSELISTGRRGRSKALGIPGGAYGNSKEQSFDRSSFSASMVSQKAVARKRSRISPFLELRSDMMSTYQSTTVLVMLYSPASDNTSSSIISFILAMCVFPEVQRRTQEEIDRVVGRGHSPTWDDEASLPYIQACVSETLRWRTVTILGGVPHAPVQDDEYRGYHIPAGTAITGNIWAIHRHPREFPAPDSFRPERFLNGRLERPYPTKKGHNAFGWGRRACSGLPLAEASLFGIITRLFWAYDIRPGLDDQGNEVTLDIFAYTSCENMHPEPFKARFIPRSPEIAEQIRVEAKGALEELQPYAGETQVKMQAR